MHSWGDESFRKELDRRLSIPRQEDLADPEARVLSSHSRSRFPPLKSAVVDWRHARRTREEITHLCARSREIEEFSINCGSNGLERKKTVGPVNVFERQIKGNVYTCRLSTFTLRGALDMIHTLDRAHTAVRYSEGGP